FDNGPRAAVVVVREGRLAKVREVARRLAAHLLRERRRALLQFRVEPRLRAGLQQPAGLVLPDGQRRWSFSHLAVEGGGEVDAVERSLRKRLADESTECRQQVDRARVNRVAQRLRNSRGPLDEAGDERAALVHRALRGTVGKAQGGLGR